MLPAMCPVVDSCYTIMNFPVEQKASNFLTRWEIISFSKGSMLNGNDGDEDDDTIIIMVQSHPWQGGSYLGGKVTFWFHGTRLSQSCSQDPATAPYAGQTESSFQTSHPMQRRSVLILFVYLSKLRWSTWPLTLMFPDYHFVQIPYFHTGVFSITSSLIQTS
jgi:hypothetical protein